MSKIHILDDNLINLIAAGEVVERPASVVKELMENSIDAEASEIIVRLKGAGLIEISVADNGVGMDSEDARNAFKQHATSKISSEQDLENIYTLGFRGEALASISSVAEVELVTQPGSGKATQIRVLQSSTTASEGNRHENGTTIVIKNLFGNIPARKKFMKTENTEFTHVESVFKSIALVNLNIHFELYDEDRLVLRLPKAASFSERVFQIFNSQTAEQLIEAEVTPKPGIKLKLHLGTPEVARKDRKLQYIYVNKRMVSDRLLQKAVGDGYLGFIHRDLQPVYFVELELDPKLVDVNVHPRKLEVRFENSQEIFGLIHHAVRDLLTKQTKSTLVSHLEAAPVSNFQPSYEAPKATREPSFLASSPSSFSQSLTRTLSPVQQRPQVATSLSFTEMLLADSGSIHTQANEFTPGQMLQLFATYIVYQHDDEVIFIDQHAAAEKVLYEKFMSQVTHATQPLLIPQVIELKPSDKQVVLEWQSKLSELGLNYEDFGGSSIQVTSVPVLLPKLNVQSLLEEMLHHQSDFAAEQVTTSAHEKIHYIIATMACHGSIRAGQVLTQTEMSQLIKDLAKCEQPYNCPHGRPVSWTLTRRELESNFKRIL